MALIPQPPRGGQGVPANYEQPNASGGADPFSRLQSIADAFERKQRIERFESDDRQHCASVNAFVHIAGRPGMGAQALTVLRGLRDSEALRNTVLRRSSLLPQIDAAIRIVSAAAAPVAVAPVDHARAAADRNHVERECLTLLNSLQGLEKVRVTNMQTGAANGVSVSSRNQERVSQIKSKLLDLLPGCSRAFVIAQLQDRGVNVMPAARPVERPGGIAWQIEIVALLKWAYSLTQ